MHNNVTADSDENGVKRERGPIPTIADYMPTELEAPSRIAPVLLALLFLIPLIGYAISKPAQLKLLDYGRGKTVEELDDEIVMPLYDRIVGPPRIAAGAWIACMIGLIVVRERRISNPDWQTVLLFVSIPVFVLFSYHMIFRIPTIG